VRERQEAFGSSMLQAQPPQQGMQQAMPEDQLLCQRQQSRF
jgi:hypothetical protein